ncbi:M28 family peptidase [Rheinheimera sp.]|uniref:M28 family peptidase n=1 Tax=Rheinheimera sp. TaxID=1869214 RepID=UPI00307F564B
MRRWIFLFVWAIWFVFPPAFGNATDQLMADIQYLASDRLEGRKTGSAGAALARDYIRQQFVNAGLRPWQQDYAQPFNYKAGFSDRHGINLIAVLPACQPNAPVVLLSAHYDHLGIVAGKVHNGADDNASGVAMMLALARWLAVKCRPYQYWFVATDAEENGLYGARHLVKAQHWQPAELALVINLDMVGRYQRVPRLYWFGSTQLAGLKDWIVQQQLALPLRWRRTEESRYVRGKVDWAAASDHAPFYRAGYPVLYFATAMHKDYHSPTDDWQAIKPEFIHQVFQTLQPIILHLEQQPPAWFLAARRTDD